MSMTRASGDTLRARPTAAPACVSRSSIVRLRYADTEARGHETQITRWVLLPDGTPDIVHDLHFVLIDRQLRIRGYYDSEVAERLDDLVRDALRLTNLEK